MLRPPRESDASAVSVVQQAAWRAAYAATPASFFDELFSDAAFLRAQAARIVQPHQPAGLCTWVAVDGADELCGFVQVSPGELLSLNVHPRAFGSGVGVQLLRRAEESLAAPLSHRDDPPAVVARLWVLESNARARRFYEREGWTAQDDTRVPDGRVEAERLYTKQLLLGSSAPALGKAQS